MQTYFNWQGLNVFTKQDRREIAAVFQAAKDDFVEEANRSPVNLSYTVLDLGLERAKACCEERLDEHLKAAPGQEFRPESLCEESWKTWSWVAPQMAKVQREMEERAKTSEAHRKDCRDARTAWQTQQLCNGDVSSQSPIVQGRTLATRRTHDWSASGPTPDSKSGRENPSTFFLLLFSSIIAHHFFPIGPPMPCK